jgi:tetratricopeptide (TPR) repeat protein
MTKLLSVLLLCLSLCATAGAQHARGRVRDEDPLAEALRVASRVLTDAGKEQSLVLLAQAHERAGRLEPALRAASAMDEGWEKSIMLSRLANSLAEAGRLERAAAVLSECMSGVERDDSHGFSYGVLIEMLGGEWHSLRDITLGSERRVGALARLIEAGRGADAARLLERARAVALDPEFDEEHAAALLAGVARRYAELGERERASAVLSEAAAVARGMEKPADRINTLSSVARVRAAGGDTREAAALLDEAFSAASALDESERGIPLAEVARDAATAGLHELASAAAAAVGTEAGPRWHLLSPLCANKAANSTVCRGLLTQAVEAAVAAARGDADGPTLTVVVAFISRESVELLPVIHGAARALEGGSRRAETLAAVGDKYAALGQGGRAAEVWREALQAARAYALTRTDYHPGDSRVNGDRERIGILRGLARRFVAAGQWGAALECAQALEANHAEAFGVAAGSVAQPGDAGQALAEVADEFLRAGRRAEAREVLAAASRVTGRGGANVSEFRRINALASLAATYARAGDEQTAAECFERALRLASRQSNHDASAQTALLIHIGAKYAEAGLKPGPAARKTLRRLVRDIEAELN